MVYPWRILVILEQYWFTKHGIFYIRKLDGKQILVKSKERNALTRQDNLTQRSIKMRREHSINSIYKVAIPFH